jgi:tetratricopeptide (TPR) repeat protein
VITEGLPLVISERASVFRDEGGYVNEREEWEKLLEANLSRLANFEAREGIAQTYFYEGDLQRAVTEMEAVIADYPDLPVGCAGARYAIAVFYLEKQMWSEALREFERLIADYPEAVHVVASAQEQVEKVKESIGAGGLPQGPCAVPAPGGG